MCDSGNFLVKNEFNITQLKNLLLAYNNMSGLGMRGEEENSRPQRSGNDTNCLQLSQNRRDAAAVQLHRRELYPPQKCVIPGSFLFDEFNI